MINKYQHHIHLIPEDDANRQLANGFLNHYAVTARVVALRNPAGGWPKVLDIFQKEYIRLLRARPKAHVVMLIDFDSKEVEKRRALFEQSIPEDLKPRVFVVGSKDEPETAERELKMTPEEIGLALAEDCLNGEFKMWRNPHFEHNNTELQRLVDVVKPFLFQGS